MTQSINQTDKETSISNQLNAAKTDAAKEPKKPAKAKKAFHISDLVAVAALLLAAVTVPDRNAHESELRNSIGSSLSASEAKSAQDLIAKASAQVAHGVLRRSSVSYIDMLGMKFSKFGVVSVVTLDGEIISVGVFNQVYVLRS